MSEDSRESVFSRWSRRKLEAKEQQENPVESAELLTEEAAEDNSPPEVAEAPEPEAPPLTDADMPDLETLTDESDYSPFMSPGVSEELRKLALRKMFHASAFNIRDGLDEYDDDFTTFEKLGDIVTSDMKHRIEMEQQKLREQAEAQAAVEDDEMEMIEDDIEEPEDEESPEVTQLAANSNEPTMPEHNSEEIIDEQR